MGTDAKNYHHGDLKKSLMDAACVHLAGDGADSFSLRALAREVGVSQTAPYRHFKTKNCLFAAIATSGFEELTVVLRAKSENEGDDVVAALVEIGLGYIEWAASNPEKYQLFFDSVLVDFSRYPELQAAANTCYDVLIQIIRKGIRQGVFLPRSEEELGGFLWSTIHGVSSLLLAKIHRQNREQNYGQGVSNSTSSALDLLKNNTRAVVELTAKAISV